LWVELTIEIVVNVVEFVVGEGVTLDVEMVDVAAGAMLVTALVINDAIDRVVAGVLTIFIATASVTFIDRIQSR
jgi:hypothetical protein